MSCAGFAGASYLIRLQLSWGVRQTQAITAGAMIEHFAFKCCFCGNVIRDEPHTVLVVLLADDEEQQLYTHHACLKQRVHPSIPFD